MFPKGLSFLPEFIFAYKKGLLQKDFSENATSSFPGRSSPQALP
jgi:hypothetical protein